MQVLRQNAETVLTILEVLLYDPLYAWTITAAEAYSRQQDDDLKESLHFTEEGIIHFYFNLRAKCMLCFCFRCNVCKFNCRTCSITFETKTARN